jgi:hypothetical protein
MNKTMKKIIFLLLIIIGNISYSQEIEFLEKNDTIEKPKDELFVFISQETDLSNSKFVAKVKSRGKLNDLSSLFQKIKNEVQKIGANSFKFDSYSKIDKENAELILSVYFCEDILFESNYKNLPKNKVYVFGNQDLTVLKSQSFKVDGEKNEIESGKFKEYDVKIGEELKVNKGGFTGMTFWIKGQKDKSATFLSFTGIGLDGGSYNPGYGSVGVSINTGRIDRIEPNFALTLLKIFEKQK